VLAVAVHHEPVPESVAYRIETPDAPGDADAFATDLRDGGFQGRITVGEDLTTISLPVDATAPR